MSDTRDRAAMGVQGRLRLHEGRALRFECIPKVSTLEEGFPAVMVGQLAEHESWRKEVHRPATHTHKWWAQRLGTVFRAILVSAVTETQDEATNAYATATRLPGLTVFDPFAGSGTTLVEATKLGARVIGWDINPVATLVQRQALQPWESEELRRAYRVLEDRCAGPIHDVHRTATGEPVLYYFWVALANCPDCGETVELFSSYVFAHHAYPYRHPEAKATCPDCHAVISVNLKTDTQASCPHCMRRFHLGGPVHGQHMTCPAGHSSRVVDALAGTPPRHRMYAKMVLRSDGSKAYLDIDNFDRELYARAERLLEEGRRSLALPVGRLEDGYNTRQALRWGYWLWEQFFNARQLYCLGLLGAAIRDLNAGPAEREALAALFSGVLEFNNLLCSFKGEGTGAVRHMFSHHVLKPERTPLEAHPWGTPASSGSFSTLFESRLLRAHQYKVDPHDIVLGRNGPQRVFGLSAPLPRAISSKWEESSNTYIRCGDSSETDIPDGSVDLVITDPPFMDNVHYSELADFFHAWLRELSPFDGYPSRETTRDEAEVQSTSSQKFGEAIGAVWTECSRVLREDGLLAFTFHQARIEGWVALVQALREAGLVVTAIQPTKAEMSVATPKNGAREPSNLDAIVVCRKVDGCMPLAHSPEDAARQADRLLAELQKVGIDVGEADVRSVVRGSVLALWTSPECDYSLDELTQYAEDLAARVVRSWTTD